VPESTLTPAAGRSASRAGEAPAASAPPATTSRSATVEPTCTAACPRVLSLVLAEHAGSFRVSGRIRVWITQQ
jgi:hypothetical protein